ncbi:hypothetical protein NL676_008221 [Syzygium grande]|nr:hypothetical protein NL676_008221 [Syzygium grande]
MRSSVSNVAGILDDFTEDGKLRDVDGRTLQAQGDRFRSPKGSPRCRRSGAPKALQSKQWVKEAFYDAEDLVEENGTFEVTRRGLPSKHEKSKQRFQSWNLPIPTAEERRRRRRRRRCGCGSTRGRSSRSCSRCCSGGSGCSGCSSRSSGCSSGCSSRSSGCSSSCSRCRCPSRCRRRCPSRPRRRSSFGAPGPPARVAKDCHSIRKPPRHPRPHAAASSAAHWQQPTIIFDISPKVIHVEEERNFVSIVQQLTGSSSGDLSPAARLAAIERTCPSGREKDFASIATKAELGGAGDDDLLDMLGEVELRQIQGILSPPPGALPAISAEFFSPATDVQVNKGSRKRLRPDTFVIGRDGAKRATANAAVNFDLESGSGKESSQTALCTRRRL